MAGEGGMGGAGGASASGGVGGDGSGGTGGMAGGGAGGTGGTAGSAGMQPDEDGGVEPDAGEPEPELPDDGEALSVCKNTQDCNGDDLVCAAFGNFQGYCAEDCTESSDCSAIEGIEATCDGSDRCVIDCSEDGSDGECPQNMVCAEITTTPISDPIFRCQYPEPKNKAIYEVCNPSRANSDCKGDLTCQMFPITDARDAVCSAACEEASDCDDLGSKATPVCDPAPLDPFTSICALECEEDDDCPNDMTCIDTDLLSKRCGHEV